MTLKHKALVDLLQRAYSAEKAAAFAYQGHAGSIAAYRHQLRLVAADGGPPAGVLQIRPVVLPEDARNGTRL